MKRARTKKNFIIILNLLLGLVFALAVGYTFAIEILNLEVGSNVYSTTTYATNQQYAIINDTIDNPILFSSGEHNQEVKIKYSFGYDFDIRIKYSLQWSGAENSDTNNVILHFANRDDYIVDNEYIYYKDTIPAGNGNLSIFTGVDFTNVEDESYIGASLRINIDEVRVYKATGTYSKSHPLYLDTQAGNAWLKCKDPATIEGDAYILLYNKRAEQQYQVRHPGVESAYYKSVADGKVVSPIWSGGNRYYAGLSAYIITGNSSISISISAVGSWQPISSTTLTVTDNNILYNYSSNWISDGYQADGIFEKVHYKYTIPANSAVYIDLVESIEITCRTVSAIENHSYYAVSTSLYFNDKTFTDSDFTNGILSSDIQTAGTFADTTPYEQEDVQVINAGVYQPGLYDVTLGMTGGSQTFNTNISLINNTSSKIRINSVSFELKYTLSNGNHTLDIGDSFDNTTNRWYRQEDTTSISLSPDNIGSNVYIAPYSSVNICDSFSTSLANIILQEYSGRYDAWVEVNVTDINYQQVSDTVTTNALAVETSAQRGTTNTTITFSVKNRSNEVISNISAQIGLAQRNPTYALQNTKPSDWESSFWKYYYLSNGEYLQVQSNPFPSDQWVTNQYYSLSYTTTNINISAGTLYNNFLQTADGYTSRTLSLKPNESAKILSVEIANTDNELVFTKSASGSANRTDNQIDIVNEGTQFAYISNDSTSSYYIRFGGIVDSSVPNIEQVDGFNYYIGIVRPGQIIRLNMSGSTQVTIDIIVASDTYTTNTLSSWGSEVQALFEEYFN